VVILAEFFDITITNLFTIFAVVMTGVVATFTVKGAVKKLQEERDTKTDKKIDTKTEELKQHFNERINEVRYRFSQNERDIKDSQDDIEDIEKDIKQMNVDLHQICTKLSRHDYVIEDLIPNFKKLKGDFYDFKSEVDKIPSKPSNIVSNNPEVSEDM
jgi:TolA-binding protein